jgi:hypothetical protein
MRKKQRNRPKFTHERSLRQAVQAALERVGSFNGGLIMHTSASARCASAERLDFVIRANPPLRKSYGRKPNEPESDLLALPTQM